ncbi:MAG: hypothetical protein JSU96_14100 [Acidobacteriota bacterium]|nr:MAG: hypothetical protein JSU96_14100 [Acidobacteriota bacterium]
MALNEKLGEAEEEFDPDPEEFEFPAEVENRQPRVVEPVVVPAPPRRHDPVAIDFPTAELARNDSQPVGSDDWAILPEGTPISIRLDEEISTEFSRPGDTYRATLDEDLVVGGRIVVPRGTVMLGEIKSVSEPGKVKGRASITFALLSFRLGEQEYALRTSEVTMEAEANKGRDAAKVGAASAIGAVLGGIFGGKKGAAIGAATGAGAGTAGVLLSKGQHIRIEKERLFSFRLEEDVELSL